VSERQKYSVSYEWSFDDIGGRILRYFTKKEEAIAFAEEADRQMSFYGVVRGNVKIGGIDDK
jgi:hypothetical protein